MYNDVWKQLKQERKARLELEKELELQIGMKTEMEIAMKLLEKDTHEKQDTLVALRQQLEDFLCVIHTLLGIQYAGCDAVRLGQKQELGFFAHIDFSFVNLQQVPS